jgi:arylsulfatase A-like enzyme
MPTLLGITGLDIPSEVQGRDMSELLLGSEEIIQESVFINYPVSPAKFSYPEWRGIITEKHTYARFRDKAWVLYDDSKDPYQLDNLAGREEFAHLQLELDTGLSEWLSRLEDPFESTEEVIWKYYKGSVEGVMPYYQNETVSKTMDKRKKERENEKET